MSTSDRCCSGTEISVLSFMARVSTCLHCYTNVRVPASILNCNSLLLYTDRNNIRHCRII
jgi:hypothetical protein